MFTFRNHFSFKGICLLYVGLHFLALGYSQENTIPNKFCGRWEGTMSVNGRPVPIAFDLSPDKNTYEAEDMGTYYGNLQSRSIDDQGNFKIVIPGRMPITLTGGIANQEMKGESQGDMKMIFSLKQVSSSSSFLVEEEVSYQSGNVSLSATLIKPLNSQQFPAVVLISGSAGEGQMTRETTRNMGYFFAKNGVAALIYDRQGNGKSTGKKDRILPMDLLAKDAAAGANYLLSRKDVQKNRIGFYGLSQGGWVAPYAANIFSKAGFIVVLSAPGITPDEQDLFVKENTIDKNAKSGADSASNAQANAKQVSEVSKDEAIPGFSHFNSLPYWEKITVPVLAIYGGADKIVPAEKSQMLIENALKKAQNNKYSFRIFPNANHSIKISLDPRGQINVPAPGSNQFMKTWIQNNVLTQ